MNKYFGVLLALVAFLGCGCGGISASKSFSPLDFFMPGLVVNEPARATLPASTNAVPISAPPTESIPPARRPGLTP